MQVRAQASGTERLGIYWALGLSVLFHLLLMLLTGWIPVSLNTAPLFEEVEREQTITFTFDRDTEPTTDDPLEDVPFQPVEEPAEAERLAEPAEVPSPAVEPLPPQPEPILEEAAAIPEEPTQEPTFEDLEPAPDDLPPLDSPSAWTQPAPEQRPTEKRLDVDRALREFRRDVVHQPVPMTPQAAESAPNIVMPQLSEIPTSGYGMGPLHFESVDYDWNDYGRQIYWAIWRAWHNRLYVTADDFEKWAHGTGGWYLQHQAQVRFVIQGNGQVVDIVLEVGSGCGPLDDSATNALEEVILPPLPHDFPRDSEVVHATFLAKGWIRRMRPALRQMKAQGLF